jgi:hypothetical protein
MLVIKDCGKKMTIINNYNNITVKCYVCNAFLQPPIKNPYMIMYHLILLISKWPQT